MKRRRKGEGLRGRRVGKETVYKRISDFPKIAQLIRSRAEL